MKKKSPILIVLLLVFLVSCNDCKESKNAASTNSNHDNETDSLVVNNEYEYSEFDLCEPDPSLHPILDSVVNSAIACPELENKGLLYCLWIHKSEDSLTRVSIELREQKRIYCLNIGKIFTYKGLIFNANYDKQYKDLFRNSGLKVKYFCKKENILMGDHDDAMVATWEYVMENNQVRCISYGFCNKSWMDEKYYKIERVIQ